jgi:hypothetical protein
MREGKHEGDPPVVHLAAVGARHVLPVLRRRWICVGCRSEFFIKEQERNRSG